MSDKNQEEQTAPEDNTTAEPTLEERLSKLQERAKQNMEDDDDTNPFEGIFEEESDEDEEFTLEELQEELQELNGKLNEIKQSNDNIRVSLQSLDTSIAEVEDKANSYKQEQINALGAELQPTLETLTEIAENNDSLDTSGLTMVQKQLSDTFNKFSVSDTTTASTENAPTSEDNTAQNDTSSESDFKDTDDMDKIDAQIDVVCGLLDKEAATGQELTNEMMTKKRTLKRASRDFDAKKDFVLEKFAKELIMVADNIDRAIESTPTEKRQADKDLDQMTTKIEVVAQSLSDSFNKFGIEKTAKTGQKFDPNYHNALFAMDVKDAEKNTIAQVMENGYTLNKRLLREAKVGIAK